MFDFVLDLLVVSALVELFIAYCLCCLFVLGLCCDLMVAAVLLFDFDVTG